MAVDDIDEDVLRQKWSKYQQGDASVVQDTPPSEAKGRTYTPAEKKTLDTLSSVKMCMQCQVRYSRSRRARTHLHIPLTHEPRCRTHGRRKASSRGSTATA